MSESFLTIAALLSVWVLFGLLGLGLIVHVRALRRSGWAIVFAPLVGHLALLVLALRLNISLTTGHHAVVLASILLLLTTMASLRHVRDSWSAFRARPRLHTLLLLALAIQLMITAPLIGTGIRTFNGYGTLDAWYYATDTYLLERLPYFQAVPPEPTRPHLHTIGTATRVGPQFAVMLVGAVLGLDELESFNLTLAAIVLLVPVSAGFLCREALALRWRWTLVAVVLVGIHSSLALVYFNQHLGHMLALALTPAALAAAAATARRRDPQRAALTALLLVGSAYAYWPTMPLVVAPAMLVLLIHRCRDPRRGRHLTALVLVGAGIVVLASPWIFARNMASLFGARGFVSRNDPVMVAFNPYLTEDLLPLASGLTDVGRLASWSQGDEAARSADVIPRLLAHHAAALAVLSLAAWGVAEEVRRRRLALPVALGFHLVLVLHVLAREYGYGVYKLVSWTHVLLVLAFVIGLRAMWRTRRRLPRTLMVVLTTAYVCLNIHTVAGYAALSVSTVTGRLLTAQNFSGNADWRGLEQWVRRDDDGGVLVGIHSHVAQHWTAFRLRTSRYAFLVPQDVLGGVTAEEQIHHERLQEVPDRTPILALDPAAVEGCRYFLDWATENDVTRNRIAAEPLERSATFALYRAEEVSRFLTVRHGWHVFENADPVSGRRLTFRWMSPRASLLLFRFPAAPLRLVLGVRAGIGQPTLDRVVAVRRGGVTIATFVIEGSARVVTPSFVPSGPFDVVELIVDGDPRPMARAFSLWNRWVVHDARRLSLGVYDVRAVQPGDEILRSGSRRFSAAEVRAELIYNGLHTDDWLGRRFTLTVPAGTTNLRMGLRLDRLGAEPAPGGARLLVGDMVARTLAFTGYGETEMELAVPASVERAPQTVTLEFDRWLTVPTRSERDIDQRRITALLRWVEIDQ